VISRRVAQLGKVFGRQHEARQPGRREIAIDSRIFSHSSRRLPRYTVRMASQLLDERSASPDGGQAAFVARASWAALSFDAVYDRHFAYVHRAMRHLGVRDESLDDAVQDVFIVVHEKLGVFDGRHAITTWLYSIVIRVARRYRKTQAAARVFESDDALVGPGAVEQDVELRRKLAIAEQALAALDKDKREIFVLGEIEQMSVVEIAQILGAPVDTLYSRLRAAKEAFHKASRRAELKLRRAP
jgi:RNA polymerase sigma-70 factor (ECF subfamily)